MSISFNYPNFLIFEISLFKKRQQCYILSQPTRWKHFYFLFPFLPWLSNLSLFGLFLLIMFYITIYSCISKEYLRKTQEKKREKKFGEWKFSSGGKWKMNRECSSQQKASWLTNFLSLFRFNSLIVCSLKIKLNKR